MALGGSSNAPCGMLRSEALLTSRAAHFVRYPGRSTAQPCRLPARLRALRCAAEPLPPKFFETARCHGLLRDDAPGSALADASADGHAMGPSAFETCEPEPLPCARTPRQSPPPLPPPSGDPGIASLAMSSLVARGTELLESSPTRHQVDTVECVAPIQDRHDASDIEQALPFIVYGYRRRVRVHVLLGESTVDLLQSFAPELSENLVERALPLTAIMCRCM